MIRLPPRSTRTDTLFPYTTLFRSALVAGLKLFGGGQHLVEIYRPGWRSPEHSLILAEVAVPAVGRLARIGAHFIPPARHFPDERLRVGIGRFTAALAVTSARRRVGTECVVTFTSWGSP